MITKKELNYVGLWAKSVPYPGDTYAEETMEKLRKAEQLFRNIYENNTYNITFSNNDEIEFEIQARNLAHIFGIDYKNLCSDFFIRTITNLLDIPTDKPFNSYIMLQKIIENSDKIINFDKTNENMRIMNYYKTSIKCDIFSKLGDLTQFNFGCINFNRDEFEENTETYCRSNSTKYLYVPSDEPVSPYFLIGILPDQKLNYEELTDYDYQDNNNIYIIETTVAPNDTKSFFKNQEVIIPTQILKDTNRELVRITATPTQKKALLKEYRSIISTYGLDNRINIYSDYLSMLSQEEKKSKIITKK